ncbi:transposase [Plakobranchus ocellatus]|uniref:Transposase n=1 Tax=Plakobranchus ocellatus TaxID=259542 RepID=A0AAV4C8P4_9GAST|nr:transposase [Plakobranchus ocellatus]
MELVVAEVVENKKTVRSVAKDFKLSRTTLARYVDDRRKTENPDMCYKKSRVTKQVFSEEEEQLLADYVIKSSRMFHGLSISATGKLALEYAKRNSKPYPESWDKNGEAGIDWFYGPMKRHPRLSVRMPEATSLARACAFNRYNVNTFFNNYETILGRENFSLDPSRV